MKEKFIFLTHTADIKFRAFGKTLEKAFSNAALALTNSMTEQKIKNKRTLTIKVNGHDIESLLYNFLEEILFLFETKRFILSSVKKIKINKKNFKLEAKLIGDSIKDYIINNHIKSPTYNEMFIKKNKNEFICQVVVDV